MEIQDSVTGIANIIFRDKANWQYVPKALKEKYFFIFNRYMAKMYPFKAFLINDKAMDKATGMDIIYAFLSKQPYPSWIWSKSKNTKVKVEISKDDQLLMKKMNVDQRELSILKVLRRIK